MPILYYKNELHQDPNNKPVWQKQRAKKKIIPLRIENTCYKVLRGIHEKKNLANANNKSTVFGQGRWSAEWLMDSRLLIRIGCKARMAKIGAIKENLWTHF